MMLSEEKEMWPRCYVLDVIKSLMLVVSGHVVFSVLLCLFSLWYLHCLIDLAVGGFHFRLIIWEALTPLEAGRSCVYITTSRII